jgi:hypothetical protein
MKMQEEVDASSVDLARQDRSIGMIDWISHVEQFGRAAVDCQD